MMKVLGIETSCDDTGVAIYDTEKGLLSHALYSQTELHAAYGGIVPELASRDHIQKTLPLIQHVMQEAGCVVGDIQGIAYTAGPGLMGALLVGASIGKSLGYAWEIPTLGVHHMEGHLLASMLEEEQPEFPFVALLVSGGHTFLILVKKLGSYELLGESLDDAAGEAFDKTAKILGLGYPGGAKLAEKAKLGDSNRFRFPRPMTDRPGLAFSFSGLKTAALTMFNQLKKNAEDVADVAAAFQDAVVDTLLIKSLRALELTGAKTLVVAGGVSANHVLRERFLEKLAAKNIKTFYPRAEFCTDNGAMIAFAGAIRLAAGKMDEDLQILVKPRWAISAI